jgi:hypothetical protein
VSRNARQTNHEFSNHGIGVRIHNNGAGASHDFADAHNRAIRGTQGN